jgi:hypothetical protein
MIFNPQLIIWIKQKLLEIDEIAFLFRKYQHKSRLKRHLYVFGELIIDVGTPLLLFFVFAHFIFKYW